METALIKTLAVHVNSPTWPTGKRPPLSLRHITSTDMNVMDMMLFIGCVAIPPHLSQVSLNAWWAWLRYITAFASGNSFMLRAEYGDLDPHQKSVLSDDFGMGASLSFLVEKLDLQTVFDGKYFVEFLAPTVSAHVAKIAKNGQFKTPDFIGKDSKGKWHVIECKGTQTSSDAREGQMTRGASQKANIVFNRKSISGQKLVSGLLIGRENGGFSSSLRIDDPEGDTEFEINDLNIAQAQEAGSRATVGRALGVAGFPSSAYLIASPYGTKLYDRETVGEEEARRKDILASMRRSAAAELQASFATAPGRVTDGDRIGRIVTMELPVPISIGKKIFNHIEARLTVSKDVYERVQEAALSEGGNSTDFVQSIPLEGFRRSGQRSFRQLEIGKLFRGELALRTL